MILSNQLLSTTYTIYEFFDGKLLTKQVYMTY